MGQKFKGLLVQQPFPCLPKQSFVLKETFTMSQLSRGETSGNSTIQQLSNAPPTPFFFSHPPVILSGGKG